MGELHVYKLVHMINTPWAMVYAPMHTPATYMYPDYCITLLRKDVQWFAAHLEHRCIKKKQNPSIKNRPLHHKHSISLGVVCFRVYLSTIFDFFA